MESYQEEGEDVVRKVKRAYDIASDHQAGFQERLDRYYNLYRAKPDQAQYRIVTRAQYVVPVCYKTVETILPRIVGVLFSADPPVQSSWRITPPDMGPMMGQDILSPELKLRMIDQMLKFIVDKNSIFWTLEGWIKEALTYGQAYLKIGWKHRTVQKQTMRTRMNDLGDMENYLENSSEVVQDEVDVQNVEIRDLFFSPEAVFPDPFGTAKYVIHRSRKRLSECVELRDAGIYKPFDESELKPDQEDDTPQAKKAIAINRNDEAMVDKDDPMITIYEYWENDLLISTANHRVCLRHEENPFKLPGSVPQKPFVSCFDNLLAGELFQVGEVEPLEHTQIEMSTLRRQRTDNNSIIINKMFIYNKNADVDLESMSLARPGGGIGAAPLDNNLSNAVQPIVHGDINGASYKEFEDLNQDAQDISGLTDYAVGTAPGREETATTVQLLQTAANQRFDLKIRNFNRAMKEAFKMIYAREKQLQTLPIPIKIPIPGQLGYMFKNVTKDELPSPQEIDLNIPGSPEMLMKDARRQRMLQYLQMMKEMPTVNPLAIHKFFVLALKEAEIDGIEPILALLEQPMMMAPPMPGGAPGGPPQPPSPPGFAGKPQALNEQPIMPLQPRPAH